MSNHSEDLSHAENVKISIESILKSPVKLTKRKKIKTDRKKDMFVELISNLETAISKIEITLDMGIAMDGVTDHYDAAIDVLFAMLFNDQQIALIQYYLFDRITPNGDFIPLETVNGDLLEIKDAYHLYEIIKSYESSTTVSKK